MIKINDKITVDFFYSQSTFSGVYIASPERLIKDAENFVESAENHAKELIPYEPIQTIRKYGDDGVLKSRLNITLLMKFEGKGEDYSQVCIGLVWFDDPEISAEDSLKNILGEINWDEAREFDF